MTFKEVFIKKAIQVLIITFTTTGKLELNPEIVLVTEFISVNPMKSIEPGIPNTGFGFILRPSPPCVCTKELASMQKNQPCPGNQLQCGSP